MKYLYIPSEDSPSEVEVADESQIDKEHLQQVDDGEAEIVRWNADRNRFEAIVISSESIKDEDGEETDELEYSVDGWRFL